jgi:5,5'-dehydrodivanillate O-demethylase
MAEITYQDLLRTGPGTLAGRFLRRFWHPVCLSRDVERGKAKPIKIMHERLTIYRGASGKPYLIGPRCAHRGAQLSAGWVEGEALRCMYHGWMFGGDGRCVDQPAEQEGFKDKIAIPSYPTQEYLGLIFAYMGEGAPPPLPRYPWFEEEGVLECDTYLRPSNYFHTLDNHSDEVHVIFTHRNTVFAKAGLNQVPTIEAEETEYGMRVIARSPNGNERANQLLMPNMIMFKSSPAKGDESFSDRVAWRVPFDDNSHLSFGVDLRHVTGAAAQRYREAQAEERERTRMAVGLHPAEEVARQILAGYRSLEDADVLARPDLVNIQDCVAQMGQPNPDEGPFEHLGRSDRGIILFRRIWMRELEALRDGTPLKEWRVPRALATQTGV